MKKFILLILIALSSGQLFASYGAEPKKFIYNLDLETVPNNIAHTIYNLLADVEEAIPSSMKKAFPKPIDVKFSVVDKGMSETQTMGWVKPKSFFHSKSSINTIYLNVVLLKDLRNKTDLFRKVLIHETGHLFDYRHLLLGQEKRFEQYCQSLPQVVIERKHDELIYGPNKPECVSFLKNKYSVSESPLFLTLSGWNLQGTIFKSREQMNKSTLRSMDSYEFTNPRETFSVNMEFFLMDEEYQCRRPTLYNYFSTLFDHKPFRDSDCKTFMKVTTSASALSKGKPQIVDLDLSRLYQVHYLFASKGEQMMSKWGHAMFRLVMCRPGRELGPKCLDDIAYHVVLSFRANVDDAQIDYLKGLNGGYDSQLFILSMKDVIDEYTKGEFRDLLSIPLKYTKEQRRIFLLSTLEQYWSYLGSYYFISNNCATETMRLIRMAAFDDYLIQDKSVFSPLGLMKLLEKNGISDMSVFNSRELAIKKGYLFPGADEILHKVYADLKAVLHFSQKSFKLFAEETTAEDRNNFYQALQSIKSKQDRRQLLAKALQLEEFIGQYREQYLMKNAATKLSSLKDINGTDLSALSDQLLEFASLTKKLGAESMITSGYGIPTQDDVKDEREQSDQETLDRIEAIREELAVNFKGLFPEELEELESIAKNKVMIKEMLFGTF